MHVNGLRQQVLEPDDSVIASARACLTPMFDGQALHRDAGLLLRPVGGAGAGDLRPARLDRPDLRRRRRHHGPPDGPAAGVRSLREAWDAAIAGVDVAERARSRPELAAALEAYRR